MFEKTKKMKSLILFFTASCLFLLMKETSAQTASADSNLLSKSNSHSPMATDFSVMGIFDGKSPCQEIARELDIPVNAGCFKLKWRLFLYHDPGTLTPTTYKIEGTFYRDAIREGRWAIVKGTKTDLDAVVYQLDPEKPNESQFFLKVDDNILFFLDKDRNFMVGNAEFSYTLNRVED